VKSVGLQTAILTLKPTTNIIV